MNEGRARLADVAAPLAAAFAWLAATAWLRPLMRPDEGRYVGVAWEMVRSGQWLTPTLDGLPYFHKPPLFYWITAAALSAGGPHEWAGRVAPWLGACLMAAACFLFARRWAGERLARAWLLVLATAPLGYAAAQFANLDMLVAGCITACILALAHAVLLAPDAPGWRGWQLAGCAAAALGVLAKGLIGIVLPGLVLLPWLLLTRRARRIPTLFWWPGVLVFAAIAAPWFLAMQARFPGFAHYFFVVQHVGRFTEHGFNNAQPAWFFPAVLALLALPWTAWLARRPAPAEDPVGLAALMWIWLAVVLAFFSLPASKLVGYVLPALPPLAFLAARRWQPAQGWLARATPVAAALLCVGAIVGVATQPGHDARTVAAAIARQPAWPVAMVEDYVFDLGFYARLPAPVPVIEEWDDPQRTGRDNWRRELLDAAAFAAPPEAARLRRPDALAHPNCPGAHAWVVGPPEAAGHYPMLARARVAATGGDLALWEVSDWTPVAGAACAGTPTTNSAGTS